MPKAIGVPKLCRIRTVLTSLNPRYSENDTTAPEQRIDLKTLYFDLALW